MAQTKKYFLFDGEERYTFFSKVKPQAKQKINYDNRWYEIQEVVLMRFGVDENYQEVVIVKPCESPLSITPSQDHQSPNPLVPAA